MCTFADPVKCVPKVYVSLLPTQCCTQTSATRKRKNDIESIKMEQTTTELKHMTLSEKESTIDSHYELHENSGKPKMGKYQ